jgi:hypothetical protein
VIVGRADYRGRAIETTRRGSAGSGPAGRNRGGPGPINRSCSISVCIVIDSSPHNGWVPSSERRTPWRVEPVARSRPFRRTCRPCSGNWRSSSTARDSRNPAGKRQPLHRTIPHSLPLVSDSRARFHRFMAWLPGNVVALGTGGFLPSVGWRVKVAACQGRVARRASPSGPDLDRDTPQKNGRSLLGYPLHFPYAASILTIALGNVRSHSRED